MIKVSLCNVVYQNSVCFQVKSDLLAKKEEEEKPPKRQRQKLIKNYVLIQSVTKLDPRYAPKHCMFKLTQEMG